MTPDHAVRLTEHAAFLERLARRLVRDAAAADDLVQDAYAAALAAHGAAPQDLRRWLAGVVRNVARATYRADERRHHRETVVAAARGDALPGPDEIAARLDMQEHLLAAVRALPEPYRTAVVHRFYDERTPAEIATLLGVPASTVRTRLARGLDLLRGRLDAQTGGDRAAWCLALLALPRATTAGTAGGVGATTIQAVGVMLMSKKVLIVAALLLLAAVVGWQLRGTTTGGADGGTRAGEVAAARDGPDRRRHVTPEALSGDVGAPAAPTADDPAGPDPDRENDLFGEVVDEDGRPVAGARVETHLHPWRRSNVLSIRADTEPGPLSVTDDNGHFVLSLKRGTQVELRVTADGRAPLRIAERQAGEHVRIVLPRGSELVVTVQDEQGVRIAGAAVTARRALPSEPVGFEIRGTTGADGTAQLSHVPPGAAEVRAVHPGLGSADAVSTQVVRGRSGAVTLTIRRGRDVAGRVIDGATGAPVVGAEIGEGWRRLRAVTADATGRFVFRGWNAPAGGTLHAAASGHGTAQVVVPAMGEVTIELTLGDVVTGRVVGVDGSALSGATLVLVGSRVTNEGQEIDSLSAVADDAGRFRLDAARRDLPHVLVVQAPGHGLVRRDVLPRPGGPGELVLGDIALPAPRAVTGRVVDAQGTPLVDVEVTLGAGAANAVHGIYGFSETRRTDDLGRFAFGGVGPAAYDIVVVRAGGVPVFASVVVPADVDPDPVTVSVAVGGRLRVRVVDGAGRGVAGAWVAPDVPGFHYPPRTDAEGRAELSGLSGATVTVQVIPDRRATDGRRFLDARRANVRVGGDEVVITLTQAVRIAGRVDDPDDRPLPRVFVRATGDDGAVAAEAIADDKGRFELFVVPDRTYRVFVDGSRPVDGSRVVVETVALAGEVRVTPPVENVVVRTRRLAADRDLEVRVVARSGAPVVGIVVTLQSAQGAPIEDDDAPSATTDADGIARFSGLPAQPVRICVGRGAVAGEARPAPVVATPGEGRVEVVCRAPAAVGGVGRRRSGAPASGAVVLLYDRDGNLLDRTTTAVDGTFRLLGLPDTDLQIYAGLDVGDGSTEEVYESDVRATTDLVLRLK